MSLSFKPILMEKVLAGEKTVTRRAWPTNYKVGQVVSIVPGMGRIACGKVRIIDVERSELKPFTHAEANAEGFNTYDEFADYWRNLHGKGIEWGEIVARIEFELVEVTRHICKSCEGIGTLDAATREQTARPSPSDAPEPGTGDPKPDLPESPSAPSDDRLAADSTDAETLARRFHETYERLAPMFGYKTREESAVPWADVPEANRNLMIAVAGEVMGVYPRVPDAVIEREAARFAANPSPSAPLGESEARIEGEVVMGGHPGMAYLSTGTKEINYVPSQVPLGPVEVFIRPLNPNPEGKGE